MAIRLVKTQGFSLLEMLIVVIISSLALGSVSAFLVQSHRSLQKVNQPLRLQSAVETALQSLQQDIHRAGHRSFATHPSYFLHSSSAVIWSDAAHQLAIIYQDPNQPASTAYFHLVYTLDGEKLIACEKRAEKALMVAEAAKSSRDSLCYSVFDPNWLVVKQFQAHAEQHDTVTLWHITLQVANKERVPSLYTFNLAALVINHETQ